MKRLVILVACVACTRGEHRDARDKYNQGLELLGKPDFEAAEKALLDARSSAGVDPELRFRAAYDLGMAYAAHAQQVKTGTSKPAAGAAASAAAGEDADLGKALELEQQAVSWFSDAARLRKGDADTQANLAIVRARAQALSDELRRGEGKLEARLDAVIGEQRSVLDDARGAWLAIKQAGGADPLAQQGSLVHLADRERGIVAEAGVLGDLASDEIEAIGKKPEDKRSDEEKVRVVQLKNLDLYLIEGRTQIADARRKLQDLAAEDGVGRAEAALVALKRAREQLLDPVTVLREVARDELDLMQQTHAIGGGLLDASQKVPAWMEAPQQAERQGGLRDRVEEVRARLAAAVENSNKPAPSGELPKLTPEQAKLIERLRVAVPFVGDATGAMDRARTALTGGKLKDAGDAERAAFIALAKAIEQFADLKQTIELASETGKQLVQLLSPDGTKLPDRITQTTDGVAQNRARLARLKQLISDELAKANQPAADPKQAEAAKPQLEAMKQQLADAERLRGEAEKATADTDAAVKANRDPLTPAKLADAKLDELRRLFFSVIEHLQELIREQGETRDQTSQASGEDDFTRGPKLPGLGSREDGHAQLAKAITDALAKQADAAAKQPPQQGAPSGKQLSAAADEVRLAQGDMTDAKASIGKATAATNQTISLQPAVDSEGKALEHLQNALKLLQPPPKQKQDDQKQDDQKQQQQPQPKGGAGQRARDEDAKRQRDKQKQSPQNDPVDKDW